MDKTINYKGHLIVLEGITAKIYADTSLKSDYIYKTRFFGYTACETVKSLKSFINLRLEQIEKDKRINIYV